MENIKKYIPGLIFVFVISWISTYINNSIKSIINLESLTIAIIIGIIYNNVIGTQESIKPGARFALKKLLKVGIVLLGFKLSISDALQLGPKVLILVVCFIPFVLLLSNFLGRLLNVNTKLSTLLGVGSSICGASAIVAMAPCINADDDDAIISVSIVSLLGAIGVLVYSTIIPNLIPLSPIEYGVWSGISLQGVAHAIAAALAMGDVSGDIGTIVKMTRVLMLVPVSLVLGYIFNNENRGSNSVKLPTYVIFFIAAVVINSFGIIPTGFVNIFKDISKLCIIMAMTGMGLAVDFKSIRDKGYNALIMGSILFLIISVVSLIIVKNIV